MKINPNTISNLPQTPGIYMFRDRHKRILYVGKAKNIKKRVSSYFSLPNIYDIKTNNLVGQIAHISFIKVLTEFEALLLEAKLIKNYQPKYNIEGKDGKNFIYIAVTDEEFPKIILTRNIKGIKGVYFGPFRSQFVMRDVLNLIRRIFPYCTQGKLNKKACFYSHLGLCDPCPSQIYKLTGNIYKREKARYLKSIRQITAIFQGRIDKVRKFLQQQMKLSSNNNDFEKAAFYRNKLANLNLLLSRQVAISDYLENPFLNENIKRLESDELMNILKIYYPAILKLERIECYDISNIYGKEASGSMVTFIKGEPDKNYYRRFRIKYEEKSNDVAMLSELIARRLRHQEWDKPDLMVVDGGKPQLIAALAVLKQNESSIPVIGLAKEYEELVIPQQNRLKKIRLNYDSYPLHLVQRLRDEAHRFAHRYHEMLRLKKILPRLTK